MSRIGSTVPSGSRNDLLTSFSSSMGKRRIAQVGVSCSGPAVKCASRGFQGWASRYRKTLARNPQQRKTVRCERRVLQAQSGLAESSPARRRLRYTHAPRPGFAGGLGWERRQAAKLRFPPLSSSLTTQASSLFGQLLPRVRFERGQIQLLVGLAVLGQVGDVEAEVDRQPAARDHPGLIRPGPIRRRTSPPQSLDRQSTVTSSWPMLTASIQHFSSWPEKFNSPQHAATIIWPSKSTWSSCSSAIPRLGVGPRMPLADVLLHGIPGLAIAGHVQCHQLAAQVEAADLRDRRRLVVSG